MDSPTTSNNSSSSNSSGASGDDKAKPDSEDRERSIETPTASSVIEEDAKFAAQLAQEEALKDQIECDSDAALALYLQKQFDNEYNDALKKQEQRLNGQSKVGISLDRFRRSASSNNFNATTNGDSKISNNNRNSSFNGNYHDDYDDGLNDDVYNDSGDDDENQFNPSPNKRVDSREAWDVFEECELKRRSRMMGRSGFVLDQDGNMITKHDIPTSSRKNMCRLMELKTEIETGDAGATKDDFKINNYVYNKLKVHSRKNSRRVSQRLFDKKERENAAILDDIQSVKMSDATRAIMDGLLIAYKIEKLNGIIGQGKESIVLHATGRDHEDTPGQEVAIKIFKSNSNMAFKTRDTYNKSKCPSYKFDKPKSKNDSLNKWAERGFKNLKLLRRAGINCPEAISLKKHVLVMNFLGADAKPSPQLKDAKLNEESLKSSYEQVVDIMTRMYKDCELIHGDLSEYNLIYHDDQVYVIDLSQSMSTGHPNANAFLFRDCKNILDFFKKSGLNDILDAKELFMVICGKDLSDNDVELWSKIEDFPRNEKLMQQDSHLNDKFQCPDNFGQLLESIEKKKHLQEGS